MEIINFIGAHNGKVSTEVRMEVTKVKFPIPGGWSIYDFIMITSMILYSYFCSSLIV